MNENDSIYIAFYNRHNTSNIGKFRYVEKLIDEGEYEEAADSLAGITDTNTIEEYRKTVLDIYLNTIVEDEELDEGQVDDLTDIANECAFCPRSVSPIFHRGTLR